MSPLTEAIDRIMKCLQQDTPELASYLLPGLTHAEIEEKVKDLPLQLPQEAWEIYQLIRGFSIERLYNNLFRQNEPNMFIFDGYALLSLEKVVKIYREKLKRTEYYYECEIERYNPNWLQIFVCYMSELEGYLVIDGTSESCGVIFTYNKVNERKKQYISLTSMMQTLAENYEQGYCNSVADPETFDEIWRKYNSSLVDAFLTKVTDEIS